MPYQVFKNGEHYDVYKVEDGKPVGNRLGRHPSKAAAQNQVQAIYAEEGRAAQGKAEATETKDGDYPPFMLSQTEAGYVTASPGMNQQCANCRFYLAGLAKCHLVACEPYPIVSGGVCKLWMPLPIEAESPAEDMGEMEIVDMEEMPMEMTTSSEPMTTSNAVMASPEKKPVLSPETEDMPEDKPKKALGLLENAAKNLNDILQSLRPQQKQEAETSGFKILEDGRFIGWWTNNFKDKEAEIISEYAIDEFIDKANKSLIPMPELWWMHIKGTKHGQVEKLFRVGHFAVAVGRFDSEEANPLVKIFKSWYIKQKNITMSHGFFYKPSLKQNGVYYHIRTYEISSLIAGREANPYTNFEVSKMSIISETQRADLEREFGKDFAERIINQAEVQGKALEGQSVAFKSLPSGFGAETMLLLGAVKAVEEDSHKANSEASEARKQAQDVGNRLDNVELKMGNYADTVQRLTEKLDEAVRYIKELTQLQPPASKSPLSALAAGDKEANFLQKKNEEQGQKFVPILEQMKSMGEFSNIVPPKAE